MSVDNLFSESEVSYGDNNENSTISPSARSISIIFTFHNVRISAFTCKVHSIFDASSCFDKFQINGINDHVVNVEWSKNKKDNNIKKIARKLSNLLKFDNNSSGFITIEIYQNNYSERSFVYKDFITSNNILNVEKFESSLLKTILQ